MLMVWWGVDIEGAVDDMGGVCGEGEELEGFVREEWG